MVADPVAAPALVVGVVAVAAPVLVVVDVPETGAAVVEVVDVVEVVGVVAVVVVVPVAGADEVGVDPAGAVELVGEDPDGAVDVAVGVLPVVVEPPVDEPGADVGELALALEARGTARRPLLVSWVSTSCCTAPT